MPGQIFYTFLDYVKRISDRNTCVCTYSEPSGSVNAASVTKRNLHWCQPQSSTEYCKVLQSLAAGVSDRRSDRWRGVQMRPYCLVIPEPKNQWIGMIMPEIAENSKTNKNGQV